MTDDWEYLRKRWYAALDRQDVHLLDPLPRRTRLRLWRDRRIDGIACWLVEHVSPRAGEVLWRACRMWP